MLIGQCLVDLCARSSFFPDYNRWIEIYPDLLVFYGDEKCSCRLESTAVFYIDFNHRWIVYTQRIKKQSA